MQIATAKCPLAGRAGQDEKNAGKRERKEGRATGVAARARTMKRLSHNRTRTRLALSPSPALSRERVGVRVPEYLALWKSRNLTGPLFGPLTSILSPRTCGERRATAVWVIARMVLEKIDTPFSGCPISARAFMLGKVGVALGYPPRLTGSWPVHGRLRDCWRARPKVGGKTFRGYALR
jgi:hypothetical protein